MPVVKGILGRKLGMTQLFDEQGQAVTVTVLEAGPCVVVQKRTQSKDGYDAVQLGFGEVKERRLNKPQRGHLAAHHAPLRRVLGEFRLQDPEALAEGQEVKADIFTPGEVVAVSGTSKGKGFAGVVKRYHFHGGPATRGSMFHRKPASSGATDAARIFKGVRKPGHMGAVRVTTKGLRVVRVDAERNLILVRGAVPGAPGSLVRITMPVVAERKPSRRKFVS